MLESLNLPIGWDSANVTWIAPEDPGKPDATMLSRISWGGFGFAAIGWFLTAIAMTLGAPFWFDTLNKFMVVRATVKPDEKSGVEGSKDAKS